MDDLQAVAFVEMSFGPAVTRHDVAIELNGDAVGFHSEDFHKGDEGEGIRSIGKRALGSVDVKFHCVGILAQQLLLGFAQLEFPRGGSALVVGLDHQR